MSSQPNFMPIATEFMGVVFRSKSEAIFAKALHDLGYWFRYEPSYFDVDGWKPDFHVLMTGGKSMLEVIIEYKPANVSETYRKSLEKRFCHLYNKHALYDVCFSLASMSAYESGLDGLEQYSCGENQWHKAKVITELLQNKMASAKLYRFDLAKAIK